MGISKTIVETPKKAIKKSYVRSQLAALMATAVDFVLALLLHHVFGVFYLTASAIGNIAGAMTNFNLGRTWVFRKKDGRLSYQAIKYLITSCISFFINTSGVYFVKEYYGLEFVTAKMIVASLVGLIFNYTMYRYFVFK